MSNIVAGIGRGQMEVLDKHVGYRRDVNQMYAELFKDVEGITLLQESSDDYFSNHWLSSIRVDESKAGFAREEFRLALLEENIESSPLWKPMHLQPVFEKCDFYGEGICEKLFDSGLCLPSGSNLTIEEKNRIKEVIRAFLALKEIN